MLTPPKPPVFQQKKTSFFGPRRGAYQRIVHESFMDISIIIFTDEINELVTKLTYQSNEENREINSKSIDTTVTIKFQASSELRKIATKKMDGVIDLSETTKPPQGLVVWSK